MLLSWILVNLRIEFFQGNRMKNRSGFEVLPRENGRCFTLFRLCALPQTFVFPRALELRDQGN